MTAAQDTARPVAAALALVLADVLGLGLPEPVLVSFFPKPDSSRMLPAVSLQFGGPDETRAVQSWADRFGVIVNTRPADNDATWHEALFSHSGVWIKAYCRVEADPA